MVLHSSIQDFDVNVGGGSDGTRRLARLHVPKPSSDLPQCCQIRDDWRSHGKRPTKCGVLPKQVAADGSETFCCDNSGRHYHSQSYDPSNTDFHLYSTNLIGRGKLARISVCRAESNIRKWLWTWWDTVGKYINLTALVTKRVWNLAKGYRIVRVLSLCILRDHCQSEVLVLDAFAKAAYASSPWKAPRSGRPWSPPARILSLASPDAPISSTTLECYVTLCSTGRGRTTLHTCNMTVTHPCSFACVTLHPSRDNIRVRLHVLELIHSSNLHVRIR